MTEAEWLRCEKLSDLVAHLREVANVHRKKTGRRKLRLLACACAREMWGHLSSIIHALVEGIELLVDGRLTEHEFEARLAAREAAASEEERGRVGTGHDAIWGYLLVTKNLDQVVVSTATFVGSRLAYVARLEGQAAGRAAPQIEDAVHRVSQASNRRACALARDIFGNPFRPVAFSPSWRTDTAISLARQMYESRDFSAMPILADALQDAGCDNEDILSHCRGDGPHVRGCWVVDLVLGKE